MARQTGTQPHPPESGHRHRRPPTDPHEQDAPRNSGEGGGGWRGRVEVRGGRRLTDTPPQDPVAGLELPHVAERCKRGGDVAELEVGVERVPVELACGEPGSHEGLELGSECDNPRRMHIVKGLDPDPVPREKQPARLGIPNREREHAAETLDSAGALLFVEVQHRFRVALGAEAVTATEELGAKAPVVVDLAVEDDRLGPILGEDRLLSTHQVDDGEPPHAEPRASRHEDPLIVGTPVADRRAHGPDPLRLHRALRILVDDAYDAAHGQLPWTRRMRWPSGRSAASHLVMDSSRAAVSPRCGRGYDSGVNYRQISQGQGRGTCAMRLSKSRTRFDRSKRQRCWLGASSGRAGASTCAAGAPRTVASAQRAPGAGEAGGGGTPTATRRQPA